MKDEVFRHGGGRWVRTWGKEWFASLMVNIKFFAVLDVDMDAGFRGGSTYGFLCCGVLGIAIAGE